MQQFTFTVTDPVGIHARPAGLLVKKAQEFESSVTLESKGKSGDAKRIFGVMGLGVMHGDTLTVTVEGSDEVAASEQLQAFLTENL